MKSPKQLPPVEKLSTLSNAELNTLKAQVKALRKENPKAVDKAYARRVRMWERKTRKGAAKPKAAKKVSTKAAKAQAHPSQEEPQRKAA